MHQNKLFEVAVGLLPGIGDQIIKQLISYCGSAEEVFKAPKHKLEKIPGIGPLLLKSISGNPQVLKEAEQEINLAEKAGAHLFFYLEKDYPARLKQIPDAPCLLYYKGNANLNAHKVVSIVGTRSATQYGRDVTQQIVADLVPHKALIVSGLAYGIDIAAHRSALQYNLKTIGVMASGIDIIYPAVHKKTAEQMIDQGGILTEFSFGAKPDAYNFPARNRIIAGLADCTIVVEANAKGGALITADIAHGYNRDVMAVPGQINALTSAGCNMLIKQNKAALYSSARDLVELMNWDQEKPSQTSLFPGPDVSNLEPEERAIIQILQAGEAEQIDTLSWKSQLPISKTASLLLQLEFKGLVKSMPGKKFALNKNR